MTTESCTSTSQMTTWNVKAMCPSLKNNNNEHLPVDCWEVSSPSAPKWTRQAWTGFPLVSCLMDACTLESALMQHLKWTYNESYTSLCHNVTQIVTWPITSYGGAAEKSPAPLAPIKKNWFHFNNEIEKPTHWFYFWTSVILSVRLNDDNHCTLSIFPRSTFSQKI